MGLSPNFKDFIRQHAQRALEGARHRGDVVFVDCLCVLHSFNPREGPRPSADVLVDRIVEAGLPHCEPGATLVFVFDRQSSSPTEKLFAQSKRRKVSREWTADEVDSLLAQRELPRGDAWGDFLAARSVRARVIAFLSAELISRFGDYGKELGKVVVHNGRVDGPAQVWDGRW